MGELIAAMLPPTQTSRKHSKVGFTGVTYCFRYSAAAGQHTGEPEGRPYNKKSERSTGSG
jgi:hypothetical protein